MRLFVALGLPEAIRDRIDGLLGDLGREVPGVRWARPEGIHLTLKFLGEVDEPRVPELSEALGTAAAAAPGGFSVEVEGLGTFGDRRRPRVVWAGVHERSGALNSLQEAIERSCAGLGFERERRPFRPHLTLARLKAPDPNLGRALATRAGVRLGSFTVDSCYLIQSVLQPEGARYVRLVEFALADATGGTAR